MLLGFISLYSLLLTVVHGQLQSPCLDVFEYEPRHQTDRWYGVLIVDNFTDSNGLSLKIILDNKADLLGNWVAPSTSEDNRIFSITNSKYKLEEGNPLQVKFFVKFNVGLVVPVVQKILLNGNVICPSNGTRRIVNPTKALRKSLRTNAKDDGTNNGKPKSTGPVGCGTIVAQAIPLIINGQDTLPGQWPWHVAIYSPVGSELKYLCGGTLISDAFVVTAAHCVTQNYKTTRPARKDRYVLYLGKQELTDFTNVQGRNVEKINIHPDYNISSFANDIAMIELDYPADINDFVRPCCLWEGKNNIDGEKGTVVGWGQREGGQVSNNLLKAELPVVPTKECLSSYPNFFARYLPESKFCAGYRNGTSVCIGDSGGGMVFPKPNTSDQDTIWQLRGVISLAVSKQNGATCDPNHYSLFTDVSLFVQWIKETIETAV